jgi:DMSO reductase anchor subunit
MPARRELPLVAFTLLGQMAAGMAAAGLAISYLPASAMWTIGLLLAAGALTSLLHLGRKRNAWRAARHTRKSWLSREVLAAALFAAAWAATAATQGLFKRTPSAWPMALLGLGLVYSMSRVYQLRAVPGWNSWRTPAAFFLSAANLGVLGVSVFSPVRGWVWITGLTWLAELGLALTIKPRFNGWPERARVTLLALGILGVLSLEVLQPPPEGWMVSVLLAGALVEEAIGRWHFYALRKPFPMRGS